MSLEEKLTKIRSPNLQSQQHTAVVLSSIEETLREQKTNFTPTAYFAALLALLKQTAPSTQENTEDELTTSTVYLLDLITSHVPAALLRTQFASIVSLLAPTLNSTGNNAPLIRSGIGCLESILVAQDGAAWNLPQSQTGPRQAIAALLSLAVDHRPKIRKRAHESIIKILQNPPPGPAIDHPAAELCATAAQNNLKNAVALVQQNRKQRGRPDDSHDPAVIHALQLTKVIATASGGWPSKKIETLCELLLSISRSRNDYLVMSAFEVFEVIFAGMQDETSSVKLPRLLDAIVELKPAQNDSQLLPPWIAILSRGYGAAAEVEPEDVFAKLPELFDLVAGYLTSSAHNIRVSASECLISFFANCVPGSAILEPSIFDEKLLQQLADRALGLLAVKYQAAWMEVFSVLSALFEALRWRGDPFLLPIIKAIGELRGNDGFQGKKQADSVLGHAIRNVGPQAVLNILPLNLIKPGPGRPGRAWLLPLLRDHVTNTNLGHFKSELLPLSEAMFQRVMDHGAAEKTMDIKVFETVVHQAWATLPGYCDLPIDLVSAVDQQFAEMVANVLYQQADLRVDLCRGLQNLVESNQAVLNSELEDSLLQLERRITKQDAETNLTHLAKFASNLLAVLFNVYSQTLPQSRAYILQCINGYLSITPEKDLVETFERVAKLLQNELPDPSVPAPKREPGQSTKGKLPPTSHTLLDLVIALSVHLPRSTFGDLFKLASNVLTNPVILTRDPQLIKKAYKLIPRLETSEIGAEALKSRSSELQDLIIATTDKTPVPARRDRLIAIKTLVSFLPASNLHFIPCVLSEIVIACKDSNERARTAGFEVLIAISEKISKSPSGTKIHNRLVPHMPDDAPDATASLEEVFTMVSAGLAGVAPHMIAASITALGRLLFEYHSDEALSQQVKEELVDTVTMFLQSNNREIVRAVLGFVKVMVVILPIEMLEPRMGAIVPGLMVWSKENKGRLRAKVKSILDRLVRRFGGAKVEEWVGADDRKMIVNIRKRRERAKKKRKDGEGESEEDDDEATGKSGKYDNEFDEAVYGSEDDDSENGSDASDNDAMSGVSFKTGKSEKSRKGKEQFIRQDDEEEEPLDLLDPRSMASISSSKKSSKFSNPNLARRTKAKVNEDGKLILGGGDDEMDEDILSNNKKHNRKRDNSNIENEASQGDAINAYLDAVDGPDAVRRGQKGRLKVKSGMQKSSRADVANINDEMDLDVNEAREVARAIMAGGGGGANGPRSPGGVGKRPQQQRRALGAEKTRGSNNGGGNRGGRGFGGDRGGRNGPRFSAGRGGRGGGRGGARGGGRGGRGGRR